MAQPGKEIQNDFPDKPHNEHVTGETYVVIAIDKYSKWLVVGACTSTEPREVIKLFESSDNLNGVLEIIKSDKGSAFLTQQYRKICKNKKHRKKI